MAVIAGKRQGFFDLCGISEKYIGLCDRVIEIFHGLSILLPKGAIKFFVFPEIIYYLSDENKKRTLAH